jgi:hypothetical protein
MTLMDGTNCECLASPGMCTLQYQNCVLGGNGHPSCQPSAACSPFTNVAVRGKQ